MSGKNSGIQSGILFCTKTSNFLKDFILKEEKGGRKRGRMCGCLTHPPTRDLAHNPGMCPDQ